VKYLVFIKLSFIYFLPDLIQNFTAMVTIWTG